MKKFLSLTIVLTMMLSVLCCLPAEARVYEDYPYIYLDFEENNVDQLHANGVVATNLPNKWKAGGANGTNGCLAVEESGDWANLNYFFKKPLTVGRKYHISLWIRITAEDLFGVTPNIQCYFYTKAHNGGTARKMVTLQGTPKPGEWVHCTATFDWDGIAYNEGSTATSGDKNEPINPDAPVDFRVRLAAGGSTVWMQTKDKLKDGKLTYDMDDVVVEPASRAAAPVYDDSYLVVGNFEDGTNCGLSGISSVQNDAERGKVGLVKSPIGSFNSLEAKNTPLQFNHLYKISCWIKRTDDYCEFGGQKSQVACINMAQGRMDKTNIAPSVLYPTYTKGGLEQNKWQYYEYYLKYDVKTFDGGGAVTGIRVGNSAASKDAGQSGEIGLEGVQYYVDDFLIQDLGCVQNGDFEQEQAPIFRIEATGQGEKNDSVFGWLPENASSSVSTDVRSTEDDPESKSTKSMSVNISSNGGRVYQGVNFDNNKIYNISFWAKGLDMADGEEKDISIKLDRKVNNVDSKDVYTVPDTETLNGKNWKLTNQWKKYECEFKPSYEASKTPEKNVLPRTPFMYFDVDGNQAGTKFLIDDISFVDPSTIVVPEVNPYPYIDGDAVLTSDEAVSGATITFKYNFASDIGKMESDSVIRALISNDGKNWGCIGQTVANYNEGFYTIPDIAIGKKLKLELAPMDEDYQMGDIKTIAVFDEVKKSFEIVPEISKWDVSTGEVAASVYIENNLTALSDQNIVVILALYDDNNMLINTTVKPETITEGYRNTIRVSATNSASATNAKLYVWSGTSLADAGETSFCDTVSYSKTNN